MYIYHDIALREFKPWSGAKAVFNRLTNEEIDKIEDYLGYEKFWSETDINDFFWFDTDSIFAILDIEEDEFWKREG